MRVKCRPGSPDAGEWPLIAPHPWVAPLKGELDTDGVH